MLQVNLLPWRQWQRQRRLSNMLCVTAALIMLMTLLVVGWRWYLHDDLAIEQTTLAALVIQQRALVLQQSQVDKSEAALLVAQQRREQNQQRHRRSLRYLDLLQAVSRVIPDEVWLTQLHEHDGKVMLSGLSLEYPQLLAFSQHLQSSGLLENLVLNDVSQLPTQRLRFVMQASMSHQESSPVAGYAPHNIAHKKERLYARILSP